MAITQLLHTSLAVSDVEQSRHFFETILELSPVERPFSFAGAWYQLGEQQLHLIQVDQVKPDMVNIEKWGRNRHVAFGVTNLSNMRSRLEHHNYPVQMSGSGRAALFTKDPDGNIIELTQIASE